MTDSAAINCAAYDPRVAEEDFDHETLAPLINEIEARLEAVLPHDPENPYAELSARVTAAHVVLAGQLASVAEAFGIEKALEFAEGLNESLPDVVRVRLRPVSPN